MSAPSRVIREPTGPDEVALHLAPARDQQFAHLLVLEVQRERGELGERGRADLVEQPPSGGQELLVRDTPRPRHLVRCGRSPDAVQNRRVIGGSHTARELHPPQPGRPVR
jgi:hypothetical protein